MCYLRLWINLSRNQNEYNPPHDHDGKLSFVTFIYRYLKN